MNLEIISKIPKKKTSNVKVLFVHGICVGGWIWDERFMPYFSLAGIETHAVSLRGHGNSEGSEGILTWTLDDYSNDIDQAVEKIGGEVIVVGHSLGGAVVQNWIRTGGKHKAKGVALLSSVPPWGLSYSSIRMAFSCPQLFQEMAKMLMFGTDNLNKEVMKKSLFSDDVPDDVLERFLSMVRDESLIASAEVQGMRPFAPIPWQLPKMFIAGAANDKFIPQEEVRRMAAYYGVEPLIVDGLAHSVMIDTNWQQMADPLISWVKSIS